MVTTFLAMLWTNTENVKQKVLPRMQRPSVQFSDSWLSPSQNLPPFLGGGAVHSRIRRCSHSGLQTDHSLHTSQLPSTSRETKGTTIRAKQAAVRGLTPGLLLVLRLDFKEITTTTKKKKIIISAYLLSMVSVLKTEANKSSGVILWLLQEGTSY